MTVDEIKVGNTLIAFFMGAKEMSSTTTTDGEKTTTSFIAYNNSEEVYSRNYEAAKSLKYHSSWDWLMGVKAKIDMIDNKAYNVVIWRADCHINDREQIIFESSILKSRETLIGIVWGCIVQFIQWYNTQTPNK